MVLSIKLNSKDQTNTQKLLIVIDDGKIKMVIHVGTPEIVIRDGILEIAILDNTSDKLLVTVLLE